MQNYCQGENKNLTASIKHFQWIQLPSRGSDFQFHFQSELNWFVMKMYFLCGIIWGLFSETAFGLSFTEANTENFLCFSVHSNTFTPDHFHRTRSRSMSTNKTMMWPWCVGDRERIHHSLYLKSLCCLQLWIRQRSLHQKTTWWCHPL